MMHKMRWDDLQFVHEVATHGSLSAAARSLGVNHATVLRRITALEDRFEIRLFERPPGGYRLTPEGRELLSPLQMIGRTVDSVERLLPMVGRGLHGRVRLTTTDSLADLILPRHLAALAHRYEDLEIELVVSNAPVSIDRAEAELTVRPAVSLPLELAGARAARMRFSVYAVPGLDVKAAARSPEGFSWIGAAPPLTRSPIGTWQDRTLGASIKLRADSFLTIARLAVASEGLAMLPNFIGAAHPGLVQSTDVDAQFETSIWVAAHRDVAQAEPVRILMDDLVEALSSDERLQG